MDTWCSIGRMRAQRRPTTSPILPLLVRGHLSGWYYLSLPMVDKQNVFVSLSAVRRHAKWHSASLLGDTGHAFWILRNHGGICSTVIKLLAWAHCFKCELSLSVRNTVLVFVGAFRRGLSLVVSMHWSQKHTNDSTQNGHRTILLIAVPSLPRALT